MYKFIHINSNPQSTLAYRLENNDSFLKWIKEEKPITIINPHGDEFDHVVFAHRIEKLLKETPLKTIALVGPYGCGKSSILNMISYYIDQPDKLNDKIIHCEVSGWGFHEGSASEHILDMAIHELSKYVDCSGLTRLPSIHNDINNCAC